jgi:hypothetical protein
MLDASPPLPPDSTISAEEVIRESMASSRSASIHSDRDDLTSSRFSDLLTTSFSGRSTFRRSTISEQMLRESELFEPERELSISEISEVLSATSTANVKPMPMTSIKEEEQDVKMEAARSRWAQHVKLRARNFLFSGMGGGKSSVAPSHQSSNAFVTSAAQEWAQKQRAILSQHQPVADYEKSVPTNNSVLGSAPGAAKLQKWNRWMQDYFNVQANANSERDPDGLMSLEEVVSNPRMMRYYAAWLQDASDQSKLFFLCSFEEYRQFWCTLRSNYQGSAANNSGSNSNGSRQGLVSTTAMFTKDDILMLRTYGVKIATKYLTKGAQFHIGGDLVDTELLHRIKRDIATGGEDALRTFDSLVTRVKRDLMERFPQFRKTELFFEMRKSVQREVIALEDLLMNHRFANFFWIFLFPHNYHREIAFWLDVEYEFKPAYRAYTAMLKTHGRRKETKEVASRQCKKLLHYICEKYYPGDEDMQKLEKSVTASFARLQREQDAILAKFNLIHVELYHRFLMSRAYTEFALYPTSPEDEESMDDLRRLSGLLLGYGLRVHHWPEEASREALRKRSLEVFESTRGFEAICGVLSFDAVCNADQAAAGTAALSVNQMPLEKPSPLGIDRSIDSFILPWCSDLENIVVHASTCPDPIAFNFKMGDSSASNELYAACVVMYKPAPPLPPSFFDKVRLDTQSGLGLRWVPYGVCILSKFALVDLLRERLAEGYEFLIELETIARQKATTSEQQASVGAEPFRLDKKVVSKISRSVAFEPLSSQALPTLTLDAAPVPPLPRLDHSIRLLFDTLDVATVIRVFAAVLLESRVLFVSTHLSVLMRVCEAMRAIMFPLLWPHVYLPVLPRRMLQYLECPTPFIFGVSKDSLEEAMRAELISDDVLVVDVDKGCIVRGEAECELPSTILFPLREGLYECLKPNVNRSDHVFAHRFPTQPHVFPDMAVRRHFYQTIHKLIGEFGYHRYVWTDEFSGKKTTFFDEASYLAASAPEAREFRTLFAATQAFSEYVVSFNGFEDVIGSSSTSSTYEPSKKVDI